MDNYLTTFREMLSLRGLSDHTLKGYCTYIRAYLDYLQKVLCKRPEDVSWQEMREFIRWLQKERSLADRTMNCVISQLRFFTLYVHHQGPPYLGTGAELLSPNPLYRFQRRTFQRPEA